jgi:NAD(P)-dependent dehydrogenase (short-subunit alcohol dehydrogenase family)
LGRLDGKVGLISGSARAAGQGACEAKLFASEGAKVVISDVLDEEGRRLEDEIRKSGGECIYVHLDVTDEDQWRRAVATAEDRFSKLDILVNNAGINIRKTIEVMTVDEWDAVMAVNLKGVFLGTKSAVPAMRRAGGGSIINVASVGGIIGVPNGGAYSATKGGVRAFTKSTAIAFASDSIRCNAVNPGDIDTDFIKVWTDDADKRQQQEQKVPLGRLGKVEEVAFAVLYLASSEASYVTGAELTIDGGLVAS